MLVNILHVGYFQSLNSYPGCIVGDEGSELMQCVVCEQMRISRHGSVNLVIALRVDVVVRLFLFCSNKQIWSNTISPVDKY